MSGVSDLYFSVCHPEIDRSLGLAFDHNPVIARILEFRSPVSPHTRAREDRGMLLRGDAQHLNASSTGSCGPCQRPCHDEQRVIRLKSADAGR
jgi:hypothetical protein